MLKSATAKKNKHDRMYRHRPTNSKEWALMNQIKQVPDIISKRIANIELRRNFLEGQNIRNNASEKMRLQNIYQNGRVPWLRDGRFRNITPVERQAFEDRVAQIDANPANRPYIRQNPIFRPIIGAQPPMYLA
jgi:hypothetical protein